MGAYIYHNNHIEVYKRVVSGLEIKKEVRMRLKFYYATPFVVLLTCWILYLFNMLMNGKHTNLNLLKNRRMPKRMKIQAIEPDYPTPMYRGMSSNAFCANDNPLCSWGKQIKSNVRHRIRYGGRAGMDTGRPISIFIDQLESTWGSQRWFSSAALDHCPWSCAVTHDIGSADIHMHNQHLPLDYQPGTSSKINVIMNFESYSDVHNTDNNTIMVSFHQESEVVANYAYSVMHAFRLCIGNVDGMTRDGKPCENMQMRASPFFHWCRRNFDGDFYTCVFNVVPHIARTNVANKSMDALGVAWISNTCERHGGYLQELMKHMHIDNMGGCYRNRDEMDHPALQFKDFDSIWWGSDGALPVSENGNRKMVIASHYKFFISIENTILDDYVTEKFYEGLLTDSVMVYLGAPNIHRYSPNTRSFINALDFESPAALASFLIELAADDELYNGFTKWRQERPVTVTASYVKAMENDVYRLDNRSMLCRVCEVVRSQ